MIKLHPTIETICITVGIIVAVLTLGWIADHAAERHQVSKASQIQTCMDRAESDLALLACHKDIA